MITVKKFTTFEELKSFENGKVDIRQRLKRHLLFEKLLLSIKSKKAIQKKTS